MKPKIIAFYLPQFHTIPENDEWWGEGFTEWTNVKKSRPNYIGHYQPEVPLNDNYYSLLDPKTQIWQSELAQKYGVYGFCYYHYWFEGKLLLEKPMENMLKNKSITIPFCICWANESWTRAWDGEEHQVLIKQNYESDDDSLLKHFDYLLQFFKDERYIKVDNKPMIIIYKPHLINNLSRLIDLWNEQAKLNGFDGLYFGNQTSNPSDELSDFKIEFEPFYTKGNLYKNVKGKKALIIHYLKHPSRLWKHFYTKRTGGWIEKYSFLTKESLSRENVSDHYLCAFPAWDNTPRRGKRAFMVKGSKPQLFEDYLLKLFEKNDKKNNGDFLFINAWNEWAEGAHLEPSEKYEYGYLEALLRAINRYYK